MSNGMNIRNMNDLEKQVNQGLKNSNKKLSDSLKTKSGRSYSTVTRKEMFDATNMLEEYIRNQVQRFYDSYKLGLDRNGKPYFPRTGKFKRSIKSSVFQQKGRHRGVVYFDGNGAYRESFMHGQPKAYLPALLDKGWRVKKPVAFKKKYHMGHYEGFHFIDLAIAEARKNPMFENIIIVPHLNNPLG